MEGMFGGRGCRYRTGRVSLRLRSWIAARLIGRRGVGRRGQDSPAPARRKCVTRNTGAAGLGSWRLLVHLPAAYPLSPEVGGVAGHARHSHAGRKEKPPPRRRREVLLRLLGLSGRQCREYFNTPTARLTRTYSGLARRPPSARPIPEAYLSGPRWLHRKSPLPYSAELVLSLLLLRPVVWKCLHPMPQELFSTTEPIPAYRRHPHSTCLISVSASENPPQGPWEEGAHYKPASASPFIAILEFPDSYTAASPGKMLRIYRVA